MEKLKKLEQQFNNVKWHHILTKENPADVASVGINLVQDYKSKLELWLRGLFFLCIPEKWPLKPSSIIPPIDQKPNEEQVDHTLCDAIAQHLSVKRLCKDVAVLTLFVKYMEICQSLQRYPWHVNWNHH